MKIRAVADAGADDVAHILWRLRKSDHTEVMSMRWADNVPALVHDVTEYWARPGWVFYGGDNDTPIAIVGATPMWPGRYQVWMLATPQFPRIALSMTKFIKNTMIPLLEEKGAIRCDTPCAANRPEAQKWLRLLGAKHEGLARNYGKNGEDFHIFRWDRRD